MRKILSILVIVLISNYCFSQISTIYIEPILTDDNYEQDQDSHMVIRNANSQNNKLFLFIGGTGSSTESYLRISEFAGNLGFDVINISYPNDIAARFSNDIIKDHYSIYDTKGQKIISSSFDSNHEQSIDLSFFESGLYFLNIGTQTNKLIKQ